MKRAMNLRPPMTAIPTLHRAWFASLMVALVVALGALPSLRAQGYLIYGGSERIYHHIQMPADPCIPDGPLVLVHGVGYSAEVWLAIGDTSDAGELYSLGITGKFDDQGIIRFPGGRVYIPGGLGGDHITLQLRAWDNRGGTISSWQAAVADPSVASGASPLIRYLSLTGFDASGALVLGISNFYGAHQAFLISAVCPEPSGWQLMGIAASVSLLVKRFTPTARRANRVPPR